MIIKDAFIGLVVNEYNIIAPIDEGAIGQVYRAERTGDIQDRRAVKFVPQGNLRDGWENEINKVTRLRNTDSVVRYQAHDFIEINGNRFLWISWDYIDGVSLRRLMEAGKLTIPILLDVVSSSLRVIHACQAIGIQHADLHSGNLIVENPNPLTLNPEQRRIWITDFGYLSASMGRDLLDDFIGLSRIVLESLKAIEYSTLESRDRQIVFRLRNEFVPKLMESNATEGSWVRVAAELHSQLENIAKSEAPHAPTKLRSVGDYLAAELIGDQYDEWRSLFVPDFIGRDLLLERNPTILTGLRGCGKTMVFRRLTALYDAKVGPSGVVGADAFLGFYVNSRVVAEAFPWLPEKLEATARFQVIHFYHICWCLEILDWLELEVARGGTTIDWLGRFFSEYFGDKLLITGTGRSLVRHIQAFFSSEMERARLKGRYVREGWELSDIRFLERFSEAIRSNVPAASSKPIYLFLDDYSTPLVNKVLQRILNPIVFRRSPLVITKIATESVESFEPFGLNGKMLEENDDFALIDCSVHVLTMVKRKNREHLSAIFKRRIERVEQLKGRKLQLADILGNVQRYNTELARKLRSASKHEVEYYGFETFCDSWSGNMREMISMFAEMLASTTLPETNARWSSPIIPSKTQDRVLRSAGGRYLSLLAAATNPNVQIYETGKDRSFGERLVKIAKSFQEVASLEMMTKNSKNQNNTPPKQPRKIEITDVTHDLPDDIAPIYSGLLRYGLFIRDYRGKSVRGKAVPRLFLRSILIPYFTLTFSKRDHLTLSWDEFCLLLRSPDDFANAWKRRAHEELGKSRRQQDLPGIVK